jgi:outer membrane protein
MVDTYRSVRQALLGLALFSVASAAQQPASTPKFAFINSQIILDRAPGASTIQSTLERERAAGAATMQKMQDSLELMITAYQKEQATLSDSMKARRQKAITDKQAQFQQRANDMERQLQQRQGELVEPLMTQIRETLEKLRTEEGYTFIFDVGQSQAIVAADKNLDITERVIARLKPISVNVTKSDSTAKAPAATKPAPAGITPPRKPPTT